MRFALLEPLRGSAAFWVFLFHYPLSEATQEAFPWLAEIARWGELAVPMFFVMSGYCIMAAAKNSIRKNESAREFLWRRLHRIYPPFWASVVVIIAIPYLMAAMTSLKTGELVLPTNSAPCAGFLDFKGIDWAGTLTLTRVFADVPSSEKLHYKFTAINAVYWSLAIEVQFYLVAAVGLCWRRHFGRYLWAVTAVSIPLAMYPASFGWGLCLPYWPMFALGIGLYSVLEWQNQSGHWCSTLSMRVRGLLILLWGMITICGLSWSGSVSHLGFAMAFTVGLYLASGIDQQFRECLARTTWLAAFARFGVGLGAMSYSVYLLHARLQYVVMQVLRQIVPVNSILFDVASLLATVALCYPFYVLCERPFIRARNAARPVADGNSIRRNLKEHSSATSSRRMRLAVN